jgi:hypothetical protein
MLKLTAITKNPTSRTKLRRATLKGRTKAMEPATTDVMKVAAPINSPIAKLPLLDRIAAKVEKTSGLPFPNARKVTPVRLSLSPRMLASVLKSIHRKSLAAMPIVLKSSDSQRIMMMNANGLASGKAQ